MITLSVDPAPANSGYAGANFYAIVDGDYVLVGTTTDDIETTGATVTFEEEIGATGYVARFYSIVTNPDDSTFIIESGDSLQFTEDGVPQGPTCTLSGRLVTGDGEPIEGAAVLLRLRGRSSLTLISSLALVSRTPIRLRTDEDGAFSVTVHRNDAIEQASRWELECPGTRKQLYLDTDLVDAGSAPNLPL